MVGDLQVHLETDVVSVTTYYQKLVNHHFGESCVVHVHVIVELCTIHI